MVKVLFVCMGNICRSPTAEGVFRRLLAEQGLADRIHIDSAGTHAYHVGEAPDKRAQAAALQRDIDISDLRARLVTAEDFDEFDYVLAMDRDNYNNLAYLAGGDGRRKLSLFLDFAKGTRQKEVPDPYYGGDKGFDTVLDLVEKAAEGLLKDIRSRFALDY